MAWLGSHTADNKVQIEPSSTYNLDSFTYTDNALIAYTVATAITSQKFRYVGMTKAAATTCVASMYTTYGTVGVKAVSQWNGAGGYNVDVSIYQRVSTQTAVA